MVSPSLMEKLTAVLKSKHLVYGYSNARIRARKAKILQWEFFTDLSNQDSIPGIAGMLERTYYKDLIVKMSERYVGSEMVEQAAGVHYAEVVSKVHHFVPDSAKPAIDALMQKWDFANLKAIITSKKLGRSWEQMRQFIIPAGTIPREQLQRIAAADGEKLFLEVRRTDVGRMMFSQSSALISGTELEQMFIQSMKQAKMLSQLHLMLDTAYFNFLLEGMNLPDAEAAMLRSIVRKEVIARNIINVLRLKAAGVTDPERVKRYLIRGSGLRPQALQRLLDAKSMKDVLSVTSHIFPLPGEEPETLVDLEIAFQKRISEERMRTFYRSTVSLGTIVSFLFIKEEEMNNLRKIVRGVDYRLSPEEIKGTLVKY